MESIEQAASGTHTPITWMVGNPLYFVNSTLYNTYHSANGDDVEVEPPESLLEEAESDFSWFHPMVSVEGAGHERNIPAALARGESGFWGIAWNQSSVDNTDDVGAPWGSYCADVTSYKRPAPDGSCAMLAFEWTARDLTRAYLSGFSYYFSTDPDDLQLRAGFTTDGAERYARSLVDAYAAAGETQGLVMMSQQESDEDLDPGDSSILHALYSQAAADGMKAETLAQADVDARKFSAAPRAVAFPYIPGGTPVPSPILGGQTLYPATIDYHDDVAGMTFIAGHSVPARLFRYSDDPVSIFNVGFSPLPPGEMATLTNAAVSGGRINFVLQAPIAEHYGLAIWANNATLQISGPGVTPAGRAGVVLTFDLQPGQNNVSFACSGCSSSTFAYST